MPPYRVLTVIPIRDEAERIAACLAALAPQHAAPGHAIVTLLNNCTDRTEAILRALAPTLPCPLHILPVTLPPDRASAGTARALAMEAAAALAAPDAMLLTTDADGRVAPDWVATNLAALASADAVCGRAVIDPDEASAIPAHLHADDADECAYGTLLDAIHDAIDPDPNDPWPRHTEASGASIGVRLAAWRRAGGIPKLPLGEDRAFIAALRRIDARIRHAPEIAVTVSARTLGRAAGGMADTMRRRMIRQDEFLDDSLEGAAVAARRAGTRWLLRVLRRAPARSARQRLANDLQVSAETIDRALSLPHLGETMEAIEAAAPVLIRRPVRRAALPIETARARRLLARLSAEARPADSPARAAA